MAKTPKDETAQAEIVNPAADQSAPVELVRMVRAAEYPEPHSADVHPDEVEHFRSGGWVEA